MHPAQSSLRKLCRPDSKGEELWDGMTLGPAGLPVLVPHSQIRFASVGVWVWPLWPTSPRPSGLAPPCPHWELDTHSQIGVEKTDMGGNQNSLLWGGT